MEFDSLIVEIGLNPLSEKDIAKFAADFMYIIKNGEVYGTEKTPSPKN